MPGTTVSRLPKIQLFLCLLLLSRTSSGQAFHWSCMPLSSGYWYWISFEDHKERQFSLSPRKHVFVSRKSFQAKIADVQESWILKSIWLESSQVGKQYYLWRNFFYLSHILWRVLMWQKNELDNPVGRSSWLNKGDQCLNDLWIKTLKQFQSRRNESKGKHFCIAGSVYRLLAWLSKLQYA